MGSGRRAGLRARGLPPLNYPTIQARGFTPGRVGKTTGANPGGYQAIARGELARGITYGFVIGMYRHGSQGSQVRPKGIWQLAKAVQQAQFQQCPWSRLFMHYEYFPDEEGTSGPGHRPPTTWRRPPCGIACISQYNRWEGRNPKVEREVRLAMQQRG